VNNKWYWFDDSLPTLESVLENKKLKHRYGLSVYADSGVSLSVYVNDVKNNDLSVDSMNGNIIGSSLSLRPGKNTVVIRFEVGTTSDSVDKQPSEFSYNYVIRKIPKDAGKDADPFDENFVLYASPKKEGEIVTYTKSSIVDFKEFKFEIDAPVF
jgi:hypothetical protein